MARAGSNKVAPDMCTYGIVIGCCYRAGRLDLGFAAVGKTIKTGCRVDAITFTQLLRALCIQKRTSDAMDIVTFNILIDALLKGGRKKDAMDLFASISVNGLVPDARTYRLMMENLIEDGLLEEFDDMFLAMEKSGCAPNARLLNAVVRS